MSSDKQKHCKKTCVLIVFLKVSQPENSLTINEKLELSFKWFQEWLLDTIFGGFWVQVGAQKSPKKGSKTQKTISKHPKTIKKETIETKWFSEGGKHNPTISHHSEYL